MKDCDASDEKALTPGANRIAMDPRLGIVDGNLSREIRHRRLGCRIRDIVPSSNEAKDGRDINDPAPVPRW